MVSESFKIKGISGLAIIRAVEKVTKEEFVMDAVNSDHEIYRIGQKDRDPNNSFLVLVDGGAQIQPNRVYNEVGIQPYIWPGGMYFAVNSVEENIRENLKTFMDKLKKELGL